MSEPLQAPDPQIIAEHAPPLPARAPKRGITINLRLLAGLPSAVFCVGGGIYLLGIKPAQENSMIALIAHGLGAYCIGKGLYCWADLLPPGSESLTIARPSRRSAARMAIVLLVIAVVAIIVRLPTIESNDTTYSWRTRALENFGCSGGP